LWASGPTGGGRAGSPAKLNEKREVGGKETPSWGLEKEQKDAEKRNWYKKRVGGKGTGPAGSA